MTASTHEATRRLGAAPDAALLDPAERMDVGELRALQIGKSYRLREEDVDAFLASRFTEAG